MHIPVYLFCLLAHLTRFLNKGEIPSMCSGYGAECKSLRIHFLVLRFQLKMHITSPHLNSYPRRKQTHRQWSYSCLCLDWWWPRFQSDPRPATRQRQLLPPSETHLMTETKTEALSACFSTSWLCSPSPESTDNKKPNVIYLPNLHRQTESKKPWKGCQRCGLHW